MHAPAKRLRYFQGGTHLAGTQGGAALIVCLLMMLAVVMLATAGAQIAIQEQKAAHNERDRLIAEQAADAALKDAESDIEKSARVDRFVREKTNPIPGACEVGVNNPLLGLCHPAPPDLYPVWQKIDLQQEEAMASVPFGFFTGRDFTGSAVARIPRYVIEVIASSDKAADGALMTTNRVFRITAIGYGMKAGTQVVLQTYYRKSASAANEGRRTGRFAWREILNWEELRDVRNQE